ncbi:MAG: DUF721 domain-containing protein [Candidatus Kapabacteria bacterium]|nr:DUF721 domain-containing protein [Candidatus Kapabacteria bacterium]
MNNNAQSIGSILNQYLRERGLEHIIKEAQVPDLWDEIIGEHAAKHARIHTFENKELVVDVTSPVWRMELRHRADSIKDKINARLGGETIRSIIIR